MPGNVERFVAALLTSNRDAALEIARDTLARLGFGGLSDDLLSPAMRRIGQMWSENQISVAHEHMASALAQSILAMLYSHVEWPPVGPKAIVTCAETEQHCFGSRVVADLLTLDGWDIRYLGGDVPTDSVIAMVRSIRPAFVAISTTLPAHLAHTRRLLAALHEIEPRPHTLVGGAAVEQLVDRNELGADATADSARGAVLAARSWKP